MIFYKICLESANRRLLNVQMTFEHEGGEFEVYGGHSKAIQAE